MLTWALRKAMLEERRADRDRFKDPLTSSKTISRMGKTQEELLDLINKWDIFNRSSTKQSICSKVNE